MTRTKGIWPGALLLAATTACGGSSGTNARAVAPTPAERQASCQAGDVASCIETARAECTDQAWQLEFDRPPSLYVTAQGLARMDRLNMMLLSTNTSEWLACIEECPGTGTRNVCIPFVLSVSFDLVDRRGESCEQAERDVHPWSGQPTRSRVRDCPGELAEITYVPSLAPVQQALIASGAVTKGSPLDIDGLVVSLTVGGAPSLTIDNVGEAACSVFDLPAGYTLVRGAQAFERARVLQPELESQFNDAQRVINRERDAALAGARARIQDDVRKVCQENGYDVDRDESFGGCTYELEAARAMIQKAISEELERVSAEIEPKIDAALKEHLIEPLCREFAAK
ncbi:MAG TPA: hypothetical protein VML75_12485 [Kofleriaceae bacterium]|nr:hypothetical protein [Kofleriaceae bacterium]